MPIFEYRCAGCGQVFEHLVRGSSAVVCCPACDAPDPERLVSLPSIRSDQTRGRALRDVRASNRTTRRDQGEAEIRRLEAHDRDHPD